MIKLLTVSAFTLALATGAMAQTSGLTDTSGSTGQPTDSISTDSTSTGATSNNSGSGTGGRADGDRCIETGAETSTLTPSGTMPEEACVE